jgi:hypothetical protein
MVVIDNLSLPQFCVARSTFNEWSRQQAFIAIVYGVVRSLSNRDEELGIENAWVADYDFFNHHRIHVMNVDAVVNLITGDT